MRVGLISPVWLSVPPEGYGGIESVIYNLLLGVQDLDLDLEYKLFSIGKTSKKTEIKKLGIDVGYFFEDELYKEITDPNKNIWDEVTHALSGWQWLEEQKVEIIHDHSGIGFPAIAQAKERRPSLLITLHGPLDDPLIQSFYRLISHKKGIYFNSISRSQQKPIPDLPWLGTVYNGIPVENFPFIRKKRNYLMVIGRITPVKGQLEAIKAARILGKDLVIVGRPEETKEGKEYWEKKLNRQVDIFLHEYKKDRLEVFKTLKRSKKSRIIYFGEANFREKIALYGRALAVLMPIFWEEPFGMVMIESLACGTPVVGFNRGAVPEIVKDGETGFVVNDLAEMIKAIENINQISPEACRQRVEKYFSHKVMAQKYYQLYQEILKKEKRGY